MPEDATGSDSAPLTVSQWTNLQDILQHIKRPTTAEERQSVRIFISFCETTENLYIVQELLDPFLEQLGFEVHYYRKDVKLSVPHIQITELIDLCDVIIGLFTKDQQCTDNSFSPAQNVISEVGRARNKLKLGLVEIGTRLGSLDYSEIPCIPFSRERHGKLLVDILRSLKNTRLITVRSSLIR